MNKKIKIKVYLLLSAVITIVGYIFFHELGHAIVMLSAGAEIYDFSILKAHVSARNGNYTNTSDLWLHANGVLLPMIISLIYSLLYKKDSKNSFYCIFSFMVALIPIGSMFPWVIIPFLYLQGKASVGNDVTNFLYNWSHTFHPLIVSVFAAVVIGISIGLMIKKRIIKNFIDIVKNLRFS